MNDLHNSVKRFMQRAKQPIGKPDPQLAARLIIEEALETVEALGFHVVTKLSGTHELVPISISGEGYKQPDMPEVIDGLCDTMYVCEWAFNNFGLPSQPFLEEVCHNNLLKVEDPKFDEDGKVQKPVGHEPPRIEALLNCVKEVQEANLDPERYEVQIPLIFDRVEHKATAFNLSKGQWAGRKGFHNTLKEALGS